MLPPDPHTPGTAVEPALTSQPRAADALQARRKGGPIRGLVTAVALIGLAVTSFFAYRAVGDLRAEVEAMAEVLVTLTDEVANLRAEVAQIPSPQVAQLPAPTDGTASVPPNSAAPDSGATTGAGLPRFVAGADDAAVGLVINAITGQEYYSGANATIAADDGTARAWFVWAHWCPFCQQEMPVVAEWVTTKAAEHPNMEVVSITTAMDPSADNPLEPYLDAGQYPFPVLIDRDGTLSGQLGVSAFPFWVFTAPDGSVLGRTAGLLPEDRLADIFAQLQELGAQAAG